MLALIAAASCASPPTDINPARQARATREFAPYADRAAISEFMGAVPTKCLRSSSRAELCQWEAGNRSPGWRVLASAIETRDWITVICELPVDGRPRAADACSVLPRRSNRYSWSVPTTRGGRKLRPSEIAEARRALRARVGREIDGAQTLVELTRLIGAIPDSCQPSSEREQVCHWQTTNRTFGQGTLAFWIDAAKSKKIRMSCTLPIDGTARQPGSCSAVVGA